MSYGVAVTRRVSPIVIDELREVAKTDPRWSLVTPIEDDDPWQFIRRGGGEDLRLILWEGELVTTSPENDQLMQLQGLAALLEASVIGEDGSDLTKIKIGQPWLKTALIAVTGVAGAALLIWAKHRLMGH